MNVILSICIPTINRYDYIDKTLNCIVNQINKDNIEKIELIIIDASTNDYTYEIVNKYNGSQFKVKYFRSQDFSPSLSKSGTNLGFDVDCDRAVQMASGKYCWLFTDDDIIKESTIDKVLLRIEENPEIVVINSEIWNKDLSYKIVNNILPAEDKNFNIKSYDEFFSYCVSYMSFVGSIIINREIWIKTDKAKYFGTGLIHLGVIFGERIYNNVILLGDPGIKIRSGNALWDDRAFEIGMINWPNMINSLKIISIEKRNIFNYTNTIDIIRGLLIYRAKGLFNLKIYNQKIKKSNKKRKLIYLLIALIPRKILYFLILNTLKIFFPEKKLSLHELTRYL
jgi:abequosyltransferase